MPDDFPNTVPNEEVDVSDFAAFSAASAASAGPAPYQQSPEFAGLIAQYRQRVQTADLTDRDLLLALWAEVLLLRQDVAALSKFVGAPEA